MQQPVDAVKAFHCVWGNAQAEGSVRDTASGCMLTRLVDHAWRRASTTV